MRSSPFSYHRIRSRPVACQLSAPSAIRMMRTPRKGNAIPDYHEEEADNRFRTGRISQSLQLEYLIISLLHTDGNNWFTVRESPDEDEYDHSPVCHSTGLPECIFVHQRIGAASSSANCSRHFPSVECSVGSGTKIRNRHESATRHSLDWGSSRLASHAHIGACSGLG